MDGRKTGDQAQYQVADDEKDGIRDQQLLRERGKRQDCRQQEDDGLDLMPTLHCSASETTPPCTKRVASSLASMAIRPPVAPNTLPLWIQKSAKDRRVIIIRRTASSAPFSAMAGRALGEELAQAHDLDLRHDPTGMMQCNNALVVMSSYQP